VTSSPAWVAVGRVTRAHGVKGEVAIHVLSQVPSRFEEGARLVVDEDRTRVLTVTHARPHRDRLLVTFDEIADREAAEALRGAYLFVPTSSSPALPEGEWWSHDVIGCRVFTDDGRDLGVVEEVIHTEANDIWVAHGEGAETLVPALRDVVEVVDVAGRRIVVRSIEGLTAP
jgi:16S rRNA processing protein RimM